MKEDRFWKGDVKNDKHMDFNEAFRPMYLLIFLTLIKIIMFKGMIDT